MAQLLAKEAALQGYQAVGLLKSGGEAAPLHMAGFRDAIGLCRSNGMVNDLFQK